MFPNKKMIVVARVHIELIILYELRGNRKNIAKLTKIRVKIFISNSL